MSSTIITPHVLQFIEDETNVFLHSLKDKLVQQYQLDVVGINLLSAKLSQLTTDHVAPKTESVSSKEEKKEDSLAKESKHFSNDNHIDEYTDKNTGSPLGCSASNENTDDTSGWMDESDEDNKYAFFPLKYPQLQRYAESQERVFWTTSHINFSQDRDHFDRLDPKTQEYTKSLLFLFAQLDGIVNENLVNNFQRETSKWKEVSMFYAIQNAIEWVHNRTYSQLIKTIVRDPKEQIRGLNSIKHFPAIRKIALWAKKWMDPKIPLLQRVVAFVCIEGIIFSSAFAGIYWLKRRNILPGLTVGNEWISRDEGLHAEFAIALYHFLVEIVKEYEGLDSSVIHTIINSAVEVTEEFTRTAMSTDLIGLNANDLVLYVKCTADRIAVSLGTSEIYKEENPLDWMTLIALPNKTNFFESKVSEYAQPIKSEFEFNLNTPF